MSNILFGLDIAAIVHDAINEAGGLLPLELIKREIGPRDPANPSRARPITETRHDGSGIFSEYTDYQRQTTAIQDGDRLVLILGASLPEGVIPETSDQILLENTLVNIVNVQRDPAAATYRCQVRD